MATRDLGTKYTCFKCETKFYDLKKPAPVCPRCGTDQREEPVVVKAPRRSARQAPEVAEELDETEEVEDEEAEEEDDEG